MTITHLSHNILEKGSGKKTPKVKYLWVSLGEYAYLCVCEWRQRVRKGERDREGKREIFYIWVSF